MDTGMQQPSRVSLEAFLDEQDFCLRSFAEETTPLFEIQGGYDAEHEDLLKALEEEELGEQLLVMFEGWDEDILSQGVPCVITDSRWDKNSRKTVVLKPRTDRNLGKTRGLKPGSDMVSGGTSEGASSEDSEPVIPVEEDSEGMFVCGTQG
jgi:hypothetical protein